MNGEVAFEIPSAAPVLSITISDTYHKAKRAALTFSSLLILASAASADPTLSGFKVHLPILRLALGAAAFYHTVLFHFEFKAMRRLNSKFNATSPAGDFTESLRDVENRIRQAQAVIEQATLHLSKPSELPSRNIVPPHMDEQLASIVKDMRERLAGLDEKQLDASQKTRFENQFSLLEQFGRDYASNYEGIVHAHRDSYLQSYRQQTELMSSGASSAAQAADAVKQIVLDINSLASTISREQGIIVNVLDRWAVNTMFGLGLLAWAVLPSIPDRCLMPLNLLCLS